MTSNGKRICKNCGYEVPADMKQCPHCGWLLEDEDDFELPSLDDHKNSSGKQPVQPEPIEQTEEEINVSPRQTSARPSRSYGQYQQSNSYDDYYHQTSNRPKPRHAEPGAFTDLDVKDLPIQETAEMKRLEEENDVQTKQYVPHHEEHRSLEDKLFDPNEPDEQPAPKSKAETSERHEKKHHSVVPAILLFIVLTLALLAGGVYLVDRFTGGNLVASLKGNTAKTAEVSAEPKETAAATATPTAAPAATPTPTATPNEHEGYIGHIRVTADAVRTRDAASLSGNEVGSVSMGQEYDVIATAQVDGYTWYEIGENQWMPSDGTWAEYTQY